MKNFTLALLIFLNLAVLPKLFSQNVGINSTGNAPDASAMLDVSSTTKGFLMPRMTTTERNAITSPATGLTIFNTTIVAYEVNIGTPATPNWTTLGSGSGTVSSVSVTSANGVSGTVANPTTTPAISLTLGAITPSSVAATGAVGGSNLSGINTGDETLATIKSKLGITTLSGSNTGDQTITLTGNVTGSGTGSFATTIAPNAVSYSKMQAVSTTSKLLGSSSATTPVQEITLGTGLSMSGTTLNSTTSSGTVTSVSVTSANGVSGTVATPTTTPAISLTLGAITPSSVAASGTVTGSNLSGSHSGTSSGTNTGDETTATIKTKLGTASATTDGYLTLTDWNTFNNKAATTDVISSLNGLTANAQTFAIASLGTAPSWGSSGSVHTLRIPLASTASVTAGLLSNADYAAFNNKVSTTRTISTTSPLQGGGDLTVNRTLSISDAEADGTTKGAAAFTAADFNSTSGVIGIDYTNGQAASSSNKGFLTSADWNTFNNKPDATNIWNLGGNSVASAQTIGTTTNFDFPFITNNVEKMRLSAGGNLGIGASVVDGANAEKLLVDAGTTSYNVISGKGDLNSYLQLNIKNANSGTSASSDVVATNDAGTEANGINFVDMGVNSSGNTSTGVLGGANTGYVYSTGSDFSIGNATAGRNLLLFTGGVSAVNERMRIDGNGNVGIGITAPTAVLHLKAGTTAANTAPLKFTSGPLLAAATAGAVEFLTDKFYGTITTGAARKEFTLNNVALTSGRVPFATTNGRLTDLSTFTYATNRLSPTYITLGAGTATTGTAPLVFTSGTNLTTPLAGAMEFDGTHFYGTVGSTRYQLDQQAGTTYTGSNGITLSGTDFRNNLITGFAGGQTVIGGSASANSLTLSSTSHVIKGKIIFGTSAYDELNNRLGVGNNVPTEALDITGNLKFSGAFMPNNLSGNAGEVLTSAGAGAAPLWTTFDTANISNFSQKVKSLFSATAPVTYSNGLIGITQASTSTHGYLSSTDWNTFNNKLATIDTSNITDFYLKSRSLLSAGSGISYNNITGIIGNTGVTSLNGLTGAVNFALGNLTETGSSVLTITGGNGAVIGGGAALQVKQASGIQDGFLSSTDWNTFNNKSSAANTWTLGGNSVPSAQTIGTTTNFDFPFITNNTERMRLSAGGNVGIGASVVDGGNAEKLLVNAGTTSYNVISGKGDLNSYLQLNIKNINSGTSASSDVVATNDAGDEDNGINYVDMGINSSGNTSTGILGGANTGYLYSTGGDFSIGNATASKNLLLFTGGVAASNERMRIEGNGNVGIGITTPTAVLHLKAGTAAANTAPLKFTSGALLTTPTIGAVEFLTDKFYGTITTAAARKEFTLNETSLGAARVPFVNASGRLTDLATFSYTTNRLSPTYLTLGAGTATAGTAPLVMTAGVNLTVPIAGAVEFDGSHYYGTVGATRYQLDQQAGTTYTGSNGISLVANDIRNNLTTGVAGGQTVTGGTASANSLTLRSTSHVTRGKILFGTSGYDELNNRLGVGNSTPTEALDVTGNLKFSGALMPGGTAGTAGYFLQSMGAGSAPVWFDASGFAWELNGNSVSSIKTLGTTTAFDLPFITNNTEKMRITSNGNVGIGTTSPTTALHLVKNNSGSSVFNLQNSSASGFSSADFFSSTGTLSGTFGYANASTGNAFFSSRDYFATYGNDFLLTADATTAALFVEGSNNNVGVETTTPNSTLDINGSLSLPIVTKTGGYTVTASDYTIVCNNGGSVTISLPSAVGLEGRVYVIKKISGAGVNVTINPNGSQTVDGAGTKVLTAQYSSVTIQSDNANWLIIGN